MAHRLLELTLCVTNTILKSDPKFASTSPKRLPRSSAIVALFVTEFQLNHFVIIFRILANFLDCHIVHINISYIVLVRTKQYVSAALNKFRIKNRLLSNDSAHQIYKVEKFEKPTRNQAQMVLLYEREYQMIAWKLGIKDI